MEELVKQILQKTATLADMDSRMKYEHFIRTFFNCKASNNHLLLLGVDDRTLIQELLGCSAGAIIKEEADYFIRIMKGRDDYMTISFRTLSKELTFEEQEQIKTLFSFYGNEKSVSLDVAFANNRIPDLIIKRGFPTCLETPHPVIRILSGKQLISNIVITTSIRNSNSLHASVQDVSIITHSNKLLVDYKVEENQESRFWDSVQKEYGDVCQFNFVILNNIDDHLMRAFTDLFKLYQSMFSIKEENRNILKRIFFIGDSRYYVSRFTDYLPSNLYRDINELVDEHKTISLYVYFLEYLQQSLIRENIPLQNILTTYKNEVERLNNIFVNELSTTLETIKKFPEKYHQLDKIRQSFFQLSQNKKMEVREKYFDLLTSFGNEVLSFSEEYAPSYLPEVVTFREQMKQQRQIYLQEKTILLLKSYEKKDKEFRAFLVETESKLNQLWTNIKENLNIVACSLSLDTIKSGFTQTQSNLVTTVKNYYTPVQRQIAFLAIKKSILAIKIKTLLESIGNLYINGCTLQSLLDNHVINTLQRLKDEAATIFESASNVYIKEAEHYQQQCETQTEIQSLLFNELRKLQLT